ncbi:hypothetical protein G6M26_23380 [Agrobacterium tumefaciens]|nr:hypothetical protein [Agrobacterium tumefaciens]NTE21486.1 hypothetical protein [Agrobacterium tumefaciens]
MTEKIILFGETEPTKRSELKFLKDVALWALKAKLSRPYFFPRTDTIEDFSYSGLDFKIYFNFKDVGNFKVLVAKATLI